MSVGVLKKDTISVILFTAYLQKVLGVLDWEQVQSTVDGECVSNLRLADDIALLSNSGDELLRTIRD